MSRDPASHSRILKSVTYEVSRQVQTLDEHESFRSVIRWAFGHDSKDRILASLASNFISLLVPVSFRKA